MNERRLAKKRLLVFLALTFALTFLYEFLIVIPIGNDPEAAQLGIATALVSLAMLIPALCSLLTRLITNEGFKNLWIKPNFKGRVRYYLIAFFGPSLLILLGAAAYYLVFPARFDINMGYLVETYASLGVELGAGQLPALLVSQLAVGIFLGPVANIVFTLGEELGWRGYMAPKLLEGGLKVLPSLLIGNIIWGLWHAPLIWGLGHNYGQGYPGYPWAGIAMMCLMCLATGTIFTWLSFKTRSCLPAALGHSAFNGMAAIGTLFAADAAAVDPFVGPVPTGILGCSALIVTAVVLALRLHRDEKRGELIYSPPAKPEQDEKSNPAPPPAALANPAGFTRDSFEKAGGEL
ncbi:MAG: CPBP family intramembrane metalloprotease [Oscillospiraceae bacterium]|nr:CPBP family intramembrane metalloprotease [Oscillospiraceae bacterium]